MTYTQITPIVPVSDLAHAGDWFRRCVGFATTAVSDTMVHLTKDAANIRLVQKTDDMDLTDPRRQQSLYIDVNDVDALYAQNRAEFEATGGDCAPFDRPYGMREIHVIYESLLIYLGQPIERTP